MRTVWVYVCTTISNDSRFDYHRNGFELSIIMALIITYIYFSVFCQCVFAFWHSDEFVAFHFVYIILQRKKNLCRKMKQYSLTYKSIIKFIKFSMEFNFINTHTRTRAHKKWIAQSAKIGIRRKHTNWGVDFQRILIGTML